MERVATVKELYARHKRCKVDNFRFVRETDKEDSIFVEEFGMYVEFTGETIAAALQARIREHNLMVAQKKAAMDEARRRGKEVS